MPSFGHSHSPTRAPSHASVSTAASQRRDKLLDKLVLQVTRKVRDAGFKPSNRTKLTIREELGELMQHGTVHENELNRIAHKVKSEMLQMLQAQQQAEAARLQAANANRDMMTEISAAGTGISRADRMSHTAPTGAPSDAVANLIPKGELEDMAHRVRSLPPLLQKRVMIQRQQGPWSEVLRKDMDEYNEEIKKTQERKYVAREEQKRFLDMQIKRRSENKRMEEEKSKQMATEEAVQREIWKEEEAEIARRKRNDQERIAEDLRRQREQALIKKRETVVRMKREEAKKVAQLQEELQAEEAEKKYKKDSVKNEIQDFLQFNTVLMEKKEREKRELASLDLKHLSEYEKRLEMQEKERAQALKKITERQSIQYNLANERHQTWQDQLDKDEEKAEAIQEAKEQRRLAAERAKKDRQQAEAKAIKVVVAGQIAEKQTRREDAKKESLRLRREVTANAARAEEIEGIRQAERRAFARQGQRDIDKQIVEQHTRRFQPAPLKIGEKEGRKYL